MDAQLSAFRKLIKLAVRIIYSGDIDEAARAEEEALQQQINPGQPAKRKRKKVVERNLAVVVIDALTRHEWVSEDKFAEKLQLSGKQVRHMLQFLETQGFVVREHRREKKKGDVVEAVAERDDADPGQISSYVSIDYPHFFDMIRLRLWRAKKAADDKVDDGQAVKKYQCCSRDGVLPACGTVFDSYEYLLLERSEGIHRCNVCDYGIVAPYADGPVDPNGERRISLVRRARDMARAERRSLQQVIRPLEEMIAKLQDVTPPDFGSFTDWVLARQTKLKKAAAAGGGGAGASVGARGSRLDYGIDGPIMGEAAIQVSVADEGAGPVPGAIAAEHKPVDARESLPYFMRSGDATVAGAAGGAAAAEGTEAAGGGAAGEQAAQDEAEKAAVYAAYVQQYMAQVAALTAAQAKPEPKGEVKEEPDDAGAGAVEPAAKRVKKGPSGRSEESSTPAATPGFVITPESTLHADGDGDFEWEDADAVPAPAPTAEASGAAADGAADEDDEFQWEDA